MNFIFDLGNVLIEWNKDKILTAVSTNQTEYDLFEKNIFQSGLWNQIDSGRVELADAEHYLLDKLGDTYQEKIHQLIWQWPNDVDNFPELYSSIKVLKQKGHHVYILSNTSKLFYWMLDHQLSPLKPVLDGFVLSCEEKVMKPDHQLYHILLDRYQIDPGQAIFFDDLLQNVRAAKEVGIEAYQVLGREDVQQILQTFI